MFPRVIFVKFSCLIQSQLFRLLIISNDIFSRFEATRQIREIEKKANGEKKEQSSTEGSTFVEWHLPVLAMTADVIQATYDKCINSGMDGYVSKPFDEQQLYQAVSRLVVGTTDAAP